MQPAADNLELVTLTTVPTEAEASVIVAALENAGIPATITGTHTASFRAEAPGNVRVVVAEGDLSRAGEVLREHKGDADSVDWSQVDVGERENEQPATGVGSLLFWRRIAQALIVLYLAWLAAGMFAGVLRLLLNEVQG